MPRTFSLLDSIIGEIDKAIKVLTAPPHAGRPFPATPGGELVLSEVDSQTAARLMRVNHAGEVAAQALYQGQALTARDTRVAAAMRLSAAMAADNNIGGWS